MNKNYTVLGLSLIVMANAMLFMGYFLKTSVETGYFHWVEMSICLVALLAGGFWNIWLNVTMQCVHQDLKETLIETQEKLTQALKKPSIAPMVISASAAPSQSRGRSGRPVSTSARAN